MESKIDIMAMKRDMKHPNFIIGLISYLLLLIGVVSNAESFDIGKIMIVGSVILGGVHWIGSIGDVLKDPNLKKDEASRYLWLALVIMIPPISGMMYYMLDRKNFSI